MDKFILVLAVNLIIVIVYFIWNLVRNKEEDWSVLFKSIVMLLVPVVGPLFIFFGFIWYQFVFSQTVDLEDVVFSKERVQTFQKPDEEREKNMVSMEEALAITDTENLRNLMLNVVRGDISQSLATIALALNSEDSETSHYAASVLQDALNDFREKTRRMYNEIMSDEKEPVEKRELCLLLLDYMDEILKQHLLTGMEQESFVNMMEQIAEVLFNIEASAMRSEQYEAVCMRTLELQQYEICEKWCQRAKSWWPVALSTYTCQLKLYYSWEKTEDFFNVLQELKQSNVVIDNETLELIRVFQQS